MTPGHVKDQIHLTGFMSSPGSDSVCEHRDSRAGGARVRSTFRRGGRGQQATAPRAGAAQAHKEQHGIARSGAELFGTLELTSHGFPLVSGL